ncbi:hypothetical protein GF327_03110 [Candidatus Woesearchaeota archaeon]|nr:hypothetical protein [Candidatus Woesearchaeota archaeon]
MDYVKIYAEKIKNNNSNFKQYKELIDSQIQSSKEIFSKRFGKGKTFKKNARKYLKEIGLLE